MSTYIRRSTLIVVAVAWLCVSIGASASEGPSPARTEYPTCSTRQGIVAEPALLSEKVSLSRRTSASVADQALDEEVEQLEGAASLGDVSIESRASASTVQSSKSSMVSVLLSWETGTLDSGLAAPLKPSFSENRNGWTPPKDPQGKDCKHGKVSRRLCWPDALGKARVGSSLHSLSVEKASWAKDGDHVLKVYARGSDLGRKGAFRSELSAVQDKYLFHEGDFQYFTMNFWLDKSWDRVTKWSTLIAQWKMSPGHPHAAVRLSNEGDYKLYFKGDKLWKHTGELDTKHGGRFLGIASPQSWNEIKIFFKKSRQRDGIAKVWLNGQLAFDFKGRTLLKGGRGYTKFGMYTNIMDERTIYFDAVSFCHSAAREECLGGKTLGQWVAQHAPPPAPSPTPSPRVPTTTPKPPKPAPTPTPRVPATTPKPPNSAPPPPPPSPVASWQKIKHKKARCRQSGPRIRSPSSLDQCRQESASAGMNAFNARFKNGRLRTCYPLSCRPGEMDRQMKSMPSSGRETWELHYASRVPE